jgi:DNA-binding MarR family transcriptional regulator
MTQLAEDTFAVTGLSPSYAFVLMAVYDEPGIAIGDTAKIMLLKPSTVTRFVEKLVQKKLVRKESEGKFIRLYPTEQAELLVPKIREAWSNLFQRYNEVLGAEFSREMAKNLAEAASKLEE